jgi:hypothetical protein
LVVVLLWFCVVLVCRQILLVGASFLFCKLAHVTIKANSMLATRAILQQQHVWVFKVCRSLSGFNWADEELLALELDHTLNDFLAVAFSLRLVSRRPECLIPRN